MSVCNWNLKTGKYFELSCQKLNYQLVSWDVVCKEETKFQSVVSVPHLNFKPIPIASPPDSVKTTHSLCWAMPCQVLRFENLIRHLPQGEIVTPVRYHQISPSIYLISPDITFHLIDIRYHQISPALCSCRQISPETTCRCNSRWDRPHRPSSNSSSASVLNGNAVQVWRLKVQLAMIDDW